MASLTAVTLPTPSYLAALDNVDTSSVLDDLQSIRAETQERLLSLNQRRDAIEDELGMLVEVLRSASCKGVGLTESLVDDEGFPRADVDLYDVRRKRHRVAVLQTDHKEIMCVLETELKALHRVLRQIEKFGGEEALKSGGTSHAVAGDEKTRTVGEGAYTSSKAVIGNASVCAPAVISSSSTTSSSSSSSVSAAASVVATEVLPITPFARVESVAAGSPADEAGLKVGDKVLSFGGETTTLANLAVIVRDNENISVPVLVVRSGAQVELALIPKVWSGRGLLGCYLVPSHSSISVERVYQPPGNPEP